MRFFGFCLLSLLFGGQPGAFRCFLIQMRLFCFRLQDLLLLNGSRF